MNKKPKYWNTAKKYLSNKDKVMSLLINKYKSPSEAVLTSRKDIFFSSGGFNPENTAGEWIGDGETGLNIKIKESIKAIL